MSECGPDEADSKLVGVRLSLRREIRRAYFQRRGLVAAILVRARFGLKVELSSGQQQNG